MSALGGFGVEARRVLRRAIEMRAQSRNKGIDWKQLGREVFLEKAKLQLAVLRAVADSTSIRPRGQRWTKKKKQLKDMEVGMEAMEMGVSTGWDGI